MSGLRLRRDEAGRVGDEPERRLDLLRVESAGFSLRRPPGVAAEQLDAEKRLQKLDLVADRRWRDADFIGGLRERRMARGRLERLKSPQRREPGSRSCGR